MWWGPKPVTQEIWGPGVTYVPNNVRTGFYAVSLDAGLYETHCSIKALTPLPSDKADLCNTVLTPLDFKDTTDIAVFYVNPTMPISFITKVSGLGDTNEAGEKPDLRRNHSILIRVEIQGASTYSFPWSKPDFILECPHDGKQTRRGSTY